MTDSLAHCSHFIRSLQHERTAHYLWYICVHICRPNWKKNKCWLEMPVILLGKSIVSSRWRLVTHSLQYTGIVNFCCDEWKRTNPIHLFFHAHRSSFAVLAHSPDLSMIIIGLRGRSWNSVKCSSLFTSHYTNILINKSTCSRFCTCYSL